MNAPDVRRWTIYGVTYPTRMVASGPHLAEGESVEVMPVQPVERPRDAEAVERVARQIDFAIAEIKRVDDAAPWPLTNAMNALSVARNEAVAALGPVERPCEVTDAMVRIAQRAAQEVIPTPIHRTAMRRALEAALGAVEGRRMMDAEEADTFLKNRERAAAYELREVEKALKEAHVALGVAVAFIPADRAEAFRERLRIIREGAGPEWICVECWTRYTSDVGHCGQLQPFECHGVVVPATGAA